MPPRYSALLLLAGLLASSSCGGAAAELRIALEPGQGATLDGLGALRFVVRELAADSPEVFGPVSLDSGRQYRLSTSVTPNEDFYVDVLGCPSVEACGDGDIVARGCTPIMNIPGDTAVDIALFDQDQPEAAQCPPGL